MQRLRNVSTMPSMLKDCLPGGGKFFADAFGSRRPLDSKSFALDFFGKRKNVRSIRAEKDPV